MKKLEKHKPNINQICIIDEAWDLMSGCNTGQFLESGYRRARVYDGSLNNNLPRIDDYLENQAVSVAKT